MEKEGEKIKFDASTCQCRPWKRVAEIPETLSSRLYVGGPVKSLSCMRGI
jgi:hypothetical protein